MNYANVGIALAGLALIATACFFPYWTTFALDFTIGWPTRQWGLLYVSTKYTNIMISSADTAWVAVRDGVCEASINWSGLGVGSSMAGSMSALGSKIAGTECPEMCKAHVMSRCQLYRQFFWVNFAVLSLLAGGAVLTLVGTCLPLIGKERKKDKTTNLLIDVAGALMAAAGCAAYVGFTMYMFKSLRSNSYFPKSSLGWCFYLAAAGTVLLVVCAVIQLIKVIQSGEKKKPGEDANPLLTSGTAAGFMA